MDENNYIPWLWCEELFDHMLLKSADSMPSCVFDEAHNFRNPTAVTSLAVARVPATRKVALTGTYF